jgi:hypothetical protein
MKQVSFSRSGQRRFNKRVNSLVSLLEKDERLFRREWHKLVQGWLGEIQRRARSWRGGGGARSAGSEGGLNIQGSEFVFGVLEIAGALLAACGPEVEGMVGEETRRLLKGECVKAVASVCGGQLNYMVDHRVYRRAKY